ncbi:MAG: hypothetical protein KDD73_15975, partial [Anaerolineales bacterium]|nr:hypothetical protein [Anaerolineales bacterium]
PAARVVIVSSTAHRFGEIDFGDLNWKHKDYNAMGAYGQSKLANLLFTYELQRRLAVAGHDTLAVAAHPGYAATNLQGDGAMMALVNRLVAQPQAMGALPPLYRPRPAPCKVDSTSDPPALPRSRATLSGSDPVSGRIIMRTRGACGRSRKR